MNKFTVLLLLPESLTDGKLEKTLLAHVEADCPAFAEAKAKNKAVYEFNGSTPCDFETLIIFDGWQYDVVAPQPVEAEPEPTGQDCKLCLIERISEFAFENVESYRNDTTGVAADLSYLLWAIAADSSFLWGNEKPDGLIKLLLEYDEDLLDELLDKGHIIKEMLPVPEKPEPLDEKRHMAEIAAVVADFICENKLKLGNEGMIAHFSTIADIALEFDDFFPADFDWEDYMDSGGDCWEMECRGG